MAEDKPARWWTTLPGLLTATAGVITAATGLLLGLHQMGWLGSSPPPTSDVAAAADADAGTVAVDPAAVGRVASSAGPGSSPAPAAYDVTLPVGEPLQLGESSYEILGTDVRPDADGTLALTIDLRMGNERGYAVNFWDDSFRLAIGEDVYAPSGGLNELVDASATKRGSVVFLIPETTRDAELEISTLGTEQVRTVPFELRPVT